MRLNDKQHVAKSKELNRKVAAIAARAQELSSKKDDLYLKLEALKDEARRYDIQTINAEEVDTIELYNYMA